MLSASSLLGTKFDVKAAALDGLAMRQEAHAQNLANVDTPGYRRKTVDFESTLQEMVNAGRSRSFGSGVGDAARGAEMPTFRMVDAGGEPWTNGAAPHNRARETSEAIEDSIRFRVLSQATGKSITELKGVISEMGRA